MNKWLNVIFKHAMMHMYSCSNIQQLDRSTQQIVRKVDPRINLVKNPLQFYQCRIMCVDALKILPLIRMYCVCVLVDNATLKAEAATQSHHSLDIVFYLNVQV